MNKKTEGPTSGVSTGLKNQGCLLAGGSKPRPSVNAIMKWGASSNGRTLEFPFEKFRFETEAFHS